MDKEKQGEITYLQALLRKPSREIKKEEAQDATETQKAGRKHVYTDLIFDILSRLPARSVYTFKGVSKPWQSMLASDHFKKMYRNFDHKPGSPRILTFNNQTEKISMIDTRNWQEIGSISLPKGFDTFGGSCNGIICVGCFCTGYGNPDEGPLLINPLTRQYRKIPPPAPITIGWVHHYTCQCNYYLGFDRQTNKFKVLCKMMVSNSEIDGLTFWYINTFGEPLWQEIDTHQSIVPNEDVICSNGSLYAMGRHEHKSYVYYFDFTKETWESFDRKEKRYDRVRGMRELTELRPGDWLMALSASNHETVDAKYFKYIKNWSMDLWTIGGSKDESLKRCRYFTKSPRQALLVCGKKIVVHDLATNALGYIDLVKKEYVNKISFDDNIIKCFVHVE